ncbi:hypothetical protein ACFVJS_02985 [Nocardioides sp. NPDC057772]|uniref:hypothetical protein n=1 Tax=Nocardioides sp. NPDC057772 TaxID=3346245 RepID=UPI00366D2C60
MNDGRLEMLSSNEGPSAREWAKTANIETPMKWGDLEREIISLRLVPEEGVGKRNLLLGMIMTLTSLVLSIFFVSPAIGAFFVAWATMIESRGTQESLVTLAIFMFVVSIVVTVTSIRTWWNTRSRSMVSIVGGVVAIVSVSATFAVGLSYDGELPGSWLEVLALAAGVLAIAAVALNLVSKPSKTGEGPKSGREQRRYDAAREEVVDVLVERGLVVLTPDQRRRMQRMRVGTWHKFDAQGRV